MPDFLSQHRWLVYGALNLLMWAVLLVGSAVGGSFAELPYLALLFAICASPILFVDALNGAYAMLAVAMAYTFVEFGLLDVLHLFSPSPYAPGSGIMTGGELLIIIGAILRIVGFHAAIGLVGDKRNRIATKDWPPQTLLLIGIAMWISSDLLNLYQALYLQVDNSNVALGAAYAKLGAWGTDAVILITNYTGPMGIMVLAYWWSVWNRRGSASLMLIVIVTQLVVGWIVDTKEIAVAPAIIILLTRFIVTGRVQMRWVVPCCLGIVLVFPILTAKRIIVTEHLQLTRAEALSRTGEILMRAITEQNEVRGGKYGQKSQTFLERATDKGAVELFVAHVGVDKPYKMGETLDQLLYVFVPRILWSDKPGANSAQTFNRDFHLSEDPDTHISPTFLGELYWNFGYTGVVLGMTLIGLVFGYVSAYFDLSAGTSITRVLVVMVTLYQTVLGQGGQIELAYVVWMRTLAIIGLMHWILARGARHGPAAGISRDRSNDRGREMAEPRFANLLH